ncbi:MAG: homoserine O-acetyltransferase [Pseudomonadales bacterium]|nr:homoserine O-acetyltransferase [Pseudomonadales bacterium]
MQTNSPFPEDSVGLVKPQTMTISAPLSLECGKSLSHFDLVFETYGTLNKNKTNAVLICHALSGNQHAAGFHKATDKKPGWWDLCIGPGKPIDTNHLFVISPNNIGGCHGSIGPTTLNLETSQPYGPDFPIVTVRDWVRTQARIAEHFSIDQWAAVIGGSLGGMQALQWAIDFPEQIRHSVIIASAPKLSAQNIAFNEIARQAIMTDPDFHDGHFYGKHSYPKKGLVLARMLGHVTYLSDHAMREKFGRELKKGSLGFDYNAEFQVESYLRHQGEVFSENFDANTYLLMTKALDYFDPAKEYENNLVKAVSKALCKFLVISFSTDWRFSPERSEEIVNALLQARKTVNYARIDAPQGHDSFLLNIPRYINLFSAYMNNVIREAKELNQEPQT